METHSHQNIKVKPRSTPRPQRSRSINPELVEPLVVVDKGVDTLENAIRIKKLRLERHTWLDDRGCNGDEEMQRSSGLEALAIVACKNCIVATECHNQDRASNAPKPGIVNGLNQDQRIMMYKRLDILKVPINYDFVIPDKTPEFYTPLSNDVAVNL